MNDMALRIKELMDQQLKAEKEKGDLEIKMLLHGTYARASKENPCTNRGVDECNTWGDYFFMEALTRLTADWKAYWH